MFKAFVFICFWAIGVAVSLALGGCGDTFNTPIKREYTKEVALIKWVEVDTEVELNKACGRAGEDRKILGCAYLDSVCTIYTHKNSAFETLGHEFMHCFTGRWHS